MMLKNQSKLKLRPLAVAISGLLLVGYGSNAAALSGDFYGTTTISGYDSISLGETLNNNGYWNVDGELEISGTGSLTINGTLNNNPYASRGEYSFFDYTPDGKVGGWINVRNDYGEELPVWVDSLETYQSYNGNAYSMLTNNNELVNNGVINNNHDSMQYSQTTSTVAYEGIAYNYEWDYRYAINPTISYDTRTRTTQDFGNIVNYNNFTNNGTLNNNGDLRNFGNFENNGTISGNGFFMNLGTLDNQIGGSINAIYSYDSTSVDNRGTINNSGSIVSLLNYGIVNNKAEGTISSLNNESGVVNNYGTILNVISNAGNLSNYGTISGSGSFTQTAGSLLLAGSSSMSQGNIDIQGGSVTVGINSATSYGTLHADNVLSFAPQTNINFRDDTNGVGLAGDSITFASAGGSIQGADKLIYNIEGGAAGSGYLFDVVHADNKLTASFQDSTFANNTTLSTDKNVVAVGQLTNDGTINSQGNFKLQEGSNLNGGGSFTQDGGNLKVNGDLTQKSVNITNKAALFGSGTITADEGLNVDGGSSVNPGNSPGTLNVIGDMTFNTGTNLNMEIQSADSGGYDVLNVSEILTFDLGSHINFNFTGTDFSSLSGKSFAFLTARSISISGYLQDLFTFKGFSNSLNYSITFNEGEGSQSLNISFSQVAAVPEPEEWAMMMLGLPLMGFVARRRKSSDSIYFQAVVA